MKIIKYALIGLASLFATSCNDFLEQEPPSQLIPEDFFKTEDQVQAAVNKFYQDMLPDHGKTGYGTYADDNGTDNQTVKNAPGIKYSDNQWRVSNTNDNWSWTNVRRINYQLQQVLQKYENKQITGTDSNIRQYIGEMYFFRAYAYFKLLKTFGDLPIITEPLPDDLAVLTAASVRQPRNEVARFIINDLDTALVYMKPNGVPTTRVTADAVKLFKSRVALFEGSWLRNFAGTPFVPNGKDWPGATKNPNYKYPTGSVEEESKYFLKIAAETAGELAEKYRSTLSVNNQVIPQKEGESNPYLEIWGTNDCSSKKEVLLWRSYNYSAKKVNGVEVAAQQNESNTGFTRSLIDSYVMKDGKPIYASAYKYDDTTLENARKNRDPRIAVLLKAPGDINCFKNMTYNGFNYRKTEWVPEINKSDGPNTGYTIRKGLMFDRAQTADNGTNVCIVFRATEALLNYIEAQYLLTGSLSGNTLEYWKDIRRAAGFQGDAIDPNVTINATDMNQEKQDWGAYTAGKLLEDKVLYNIRRERRCELIAEGRRNEDLLRWRSYDQLITNRAHIEGFHLWNTPMEKWYSGLIADGSGSANVSSKSLSEYFRPHEILKSNIYYNGLTWHMAHYLNPLPLRQFILTASDHATPTESPLYQNPYWPLKADATAEQ